METELRSLAEAPSVNGRIHVMPPVPPDVLDRYVAGADAVAILNQPASLNELLSTPNKLFEALGAGVPVVTSDFPLRREIVVEGSDGPLGVMCDPTNRSSIAASLAFLLTKPLEAREAQRSRCLDAAHRRWNWEREQESLLAAYDALLEDVPARASVTSTKRAVW